MDNRIYNIGTFLIFILLLFACTEKKIMNQEQEFDPPKAEIKEHQHKIHNDIRVDEFYWLNNPDDPEVIDYLEKYAETGKEYTEVLKKIIIQNNLVDFDDVEILPTSLKMKNLI